jgi:hypothetical protein
VAIPERASQPRPKLLDPASEVGFLGDVSIPSELYFVSRDPVVIAGMGFPARVDWQLLAEAGVGHMVCLTHHDAAPYNAAPIRVTAIGLEDLWTATAPTDPVTERRRVGEAADAVVRSVHSGEGVAVHCRGGRGRAGTVIGVALVRLGHEPEHIIAYLHTLHVRRGKLGWPESPWQAEMISDLGALP